MSEANDDALREEINASSEALPANQGENQIKTDLQIAVQTEEEALKSQMEKIDELKLNSNDHEQESHPPESCQIDKVVYSLKKKESFLIKELSEETDITLNGKTIKKEDLTALFSKHEPLNDEIKVEIHQVENENGSKYYGEYNKEKKQKHGRGILIWTDGSRYEGYWKNDKSNISGILFHADGDYYNGEWLDDRAHGYGVYTHLDGAKYEGKWKEDKQDGHGKETWPDGASYEGDYKQGKKCGKGLFKWPDGSRYEGNFSENTINGKGIYIWSDERKYEGEWKDNKMEGEGVFIWPDGRKYTGMYKEDKKHGHGEFEWADGRKYRGEWSNGKQHGEGKFFNLHTNVWQEGIWNNGKRVKWVKREETSAD